MTSAVSRLIVLVTVLLQDAATEVACDPDIDNCTDIEDDHDHDDHDHDDHDAEGVSNTSLDDLHFILRRLTRPCRPDE